MEIQFLGATHTVTGSKYLIRAENSNILVDCGLFQGYKELRLRNWNPLPIKPTEIDYVLLTHAHIDHSGYIPLLVKEGFRGKIYCSEATRDLCAILLPDSGHIHEEEARYANRKGYSKHHPALALYTQRQAEAAMALFKPIPFDKTITLAGGLSCCFYYGGHILGAAQIMVEHKGTSILFSGDLGRADDPIMRPPQPPPQVDYLVVESTYGDRTHQHIDVEETLADIVNRTAERGGTVLIPAFAVGRSQSILYYLHQLKQHNKIPNIPVFIDSPMATSATKLFYQHAEQHRLSRSQSLSVCKTAQYVQSAEQSYQLDQKKMPKVIISASGMVTGGRILHHIKNLAPDHRNTLVFCGYQAAGTRGGRIVRGEPEVKMHGQMVPIHAEVAQLGNLSAHADYKDMLAWLGHLKLPPKKVFITHGEDQGAHGLKDRIEQQLGWQCEVPDYLQGVDLI